MIEMKPLSDEQKKEIDELFRQVMDSGEPLPFKVIEKENYIALYSDNPHVIKALLLEAIVSLVKRGDRK